MTDQLEGQHPLQISSVERLPLGRDRIALRVRGVWHDRRQVPPGRAQLVVEVEGRREHFPVAPDAGQLDLEPGVWSATFALPSWLEPHLDGGTSYLELGSALIRLPATSDTGARPASRGPADAAAQLTARIRHLERSLAAARQEPSRLRELLARTQADLDARAAQQEHFESMRSDLRDELGHLRAAVDHERARRAELESRANILTELSNELREELAEATVAKEAAEHEAAALRTELGRLATALSAVHEQTGPGASAVVQAETLLAETRSVKARIQERLNGSLRAEDGD